MISLWPFTPNNLYLADIHLCYYAVGVKAHKENNKVLIFCASKYKLHVAKTKHNIKTPDTIFYYAYWAYQIKTRNKIL